MVFGTAFGEVAVGATIGSGLILLAGAVWLGEFDPTDGSGVVGCAGLGGGTVFGAVVGTVEAGAAARCQVSVTQYQTYPALITS